jgi:single-strand DNA-binding protein
VINKVILIGNIGTDLDTRTFSNNNKVMSFSLATSEKWKGKDGQQQERTQWHKISIFNENLINVLDSYAGKGTKIYLEGKLQTRKYQDSSGSDRYVTEVVLERYNGVIQLLSKSSSDGQPKMSPNRKVVDEYPLDDEIPF